MRDWGQTALVSGPHDLILRSNQRTDHVVVKVGVHVPPLSSAEQEPDQGEDGDQTHDTADHSTDNGTRVCEGVSAIRVEKRSEGQDSLVPPPLLAPSVVTDPTPDEVDTDPSALVMVV